MFFSPELLARRDSGFGLLWLAATLGSKSTFKKLPKRSILTADIARLCDLIAQPIEPLALRLSSNLMVGVARVYKVKQEIFMTDVTSCVASLKKVVQELKSTTTVDARLQMAQPSVRPSALTLVADPNSAVVMDFEALVANWDEYLNIGVAIEGDAEPDSGQFNLDVRKRRNKTNMLVTRLPHTEAVRAEQHTLVEHHEHLLSASFDRSYGDNRDATDPSSSQAGAAFGFEDNFFALTDGLDISALADELERELGWGVSQRINENISIEVDNVAHGSDIDFRSDKGQPFNESTGPDFVGMLLSSAFNTPRRLERKTIEPLQKGNRHPTPSLRLKGTSALHGLSPTTSSYRLPLSQGEQLPLTDVTANLHNQAKKGICSKKLKRTHLLLDTRTELTDGELKAARTQYIQSQGILRRTIGLRQTEKEKEKMVEEMVWGVPSCIQAPALADFWQENLKVQVDARSRPLYTHPRGGMTRTTKTIDLKIMEEPPKKRRKTRDVSHVHADETLGDNMSLRDLFFDTSKETFAGIGTDVNDEAPGFGHGNDENLGRRLHSSEEPGQGRHASPLRSLLQDFDFNVAPIGSQKSSLFPWDNAGGCSSSGNFGMPGSNQAYFTDHADMRLRGSSLGRRDSSLVPSQLESLVGDPGFFPAPVRKFSRSLDEDYAFEVDPTKYSAANYSQRSNNTDVISLERNSLNFLEYAKMQLRSLPLPASDLDFGIIAPRGTSTRHVAAAAFYHCLGALTHFQLCSLLRPINRH